MSRRALGADHTWIVFFFSSRRRHTRYIGDWSSDVCSSDLPLLNAAYISATYRSYTHRQICFSRFPKPEPSADGDGGAWRRLRSEERRVGKEWRSRRGP